MTRRSRMAAICAAAFFGAALLFTILVFTVDVQPIGPQNPNKPHLYYSVGFAAMNAAFRNAIQTSPFCYTAFFIVSILALLLALVPIGLCVFQFIQTKDLKKINFSLLMLTAFYLVVIVFMILFLLLPIEFRPVKEMNGKVKTSFPSPVLMAVLALFATCPTAVRALMGKWSGQFYVRIACYVLALFSFFMSMFSGVHWLSDAMAAVLYAGALVACFYFIYFQMRAKRRAAKKRAQLKEQ